ncbi:MAG: sulfite exporter TauE/SafE family protein [Chloroflexi bacterium]|nr:sulfite exporter TauE/SafE family protein [Chloroflexota bacterium]MCH8008691.1 sulfite exporter TauE/SafE family protein [Chloroflexota bacterium]
MRWYSARSVITGATGGFFSGLTGVGGGVVMVPLLTSLLRLPQHLAHGTSLAIVIFVATAGLAGYWRTDNVDWGLAPWLALGGAAGAYVGAVSMSKLAPRALRFVFGVFLLGVAVRMFIL